MGLKVLLTNNTLRDRAGSELYVRDVALGLLRRGHSPIAFSTVLGDVADELRKATVPVVDRLDAVGSDPDVIHGHHHLETTMAALHFPKVPVVHFCHGWLPWEENPAKLPSIVRYVAVDRTCLDRLRFEHGIPEGRISVLHNFVDLTRFPLGSPRRARPERALVFSNQAQESTHLPAIRAACEQRGIQVETVGMASGRTLHQPETVLGSYDLVFGKARAAMEAMACGCAVILCDRAGLGPLVRSERFHELFALNFGIRTLRGELCVDAVGEAIDGYDAGDAARVAALMREHGDLERRLDDLVELYEAAIRSQTEIDAAGMCRAGSNYLGWLTPRIKGYETAVWKWEDSELRCRDLEARRADLERRAAEAERAVAETYKHVTLAQNERLGEALRRAELEAGDATRILQQTEARAREAEKQRIAAVAETERMNQFVVMRFRRFVNRLPVIGRLARGLVRLVFYRG